MGLGWTSPPSPLQKERGVCRGKSGMIVAGDLTMTDQELLNRITINPKVMVGKPVIRGTRLTVEFILNLVAHGATMDEVIKEYQGLKIEDVRACILFTMA